MLKEKPYTKRGRKANTYRDVLSFPG